MLIKNFIILIVNLCLDIGYEGIIWIKIRENFVEKQGKFQHFKNISHIMNNPLFLR